MLIFPKHFSEHKEYIGSKALNLKKLEAMGLRVPKFAAVPSTAIVRLWEETQAGKRDRLHSLEKEITQGIPAASYAVRSSALVEDDSKNSYAGQFLTRLNVSPRQLQDALIDVITDGYGKLNGSLGGFSIIVQEYIPASSSGVVFTRNPFGGREMIIEWNRGTGAKVVGGQTLPHKITLFWTGRAPGGLPGLAQAIASFKDIERLFGHPQDIEWCLKGNEWYFLQARPITTLSPAQYRESLYLDKVLPAAEKYFYEKTEVSEIAPRPTPFTMSLLSLIYRSGGPVDRTYKKFGIGYKPADIFKIVGNELYIDREKEIKTLFPAYSYFGKSSLKPRLSGFKGLLATIRNIIKINTLPLRPKPLLSLIKERLAAATEGQGVQEAVRHFMDDYELIFQINLLAEKAVQRLQTALGNDEHRLSVLLNSFVDERSEEVVLAGGVLLGNSLEVSDTTPFSNRVGQSVQDVFCMGPGLVDVTGWKRIQLEKLLKMAQSFNRLREYGRWLTVKHINFIRNELLQLAAEKGFEDPQHIYFLTHGEVLHGRIAEDVCRHRLVEYREYQSFSLPTVLTSVSHPHSQLKPIGVSPGTATGKLVPLLALNEDGANAILYTKILSPDLVQHFPKIKGIVSEKGGMLSHLAIMARERNVPVVVNVSLEDLGLHLGQTISIDGSAGQVTAVSEQLMAHAKK